jgi:hypothetical protein
LAEEPIRFHVDGQRALRTDDDLRDALREGQLDADVRLRLEGTALWAPARAWATLAVRTSLSEMPKAPAADEGPASVSPDLLGAPRFLHDMLLWCVVEGDRTFGPMVGAEIRDQFEGGKYRRARATPVGLGDWILVGRIFDRTLTDANRAAPAILLPELRRVRCPTCKEEISSAAIICPECEESVEAAGSPPSSARSSVPDEDPTAGFFALHWRPMLTLGAIASLLIAGITLRYMAPGRFAEERVATHGRRATAACDDPCWPGESCQLGACTWTAPPSARHLADKPQVSGPFALPLDASDGVVLDEDRFAVGLLSGVQVRSMRTGQVLGLLSEAIQARKLVRVGDVIYAVGPQQIRVIDAQSTKLLKTLEMGAIVGDVTLGANGRRAMVSLPGAHAIAVLSTELHAEIDRIRFGEDAVGPVGADDTGTRALTTNGAIPPDGLPDPSTSDGAVYAFDPSRLASAQDRVRTSLVGNPVAVLMTPDGSASYVALRARDVILPLEWLPSGAVRQKEPIEACDQPEQVELVRKDRRMLVRCDAGRSLEVFDLRTSEILRHVPFSSPAADLVVTPDGRQAIVALPDQDKGAIAIVDLDSFDVEIVPLSAPPSRVRMAPDGSSVLVLGARTKSAWVVR